MSTKKGEEEGTHIVLRADLVRDLTPLANQVHLSLTSYVHLILGVHTLQKGTFKPWDPTTSENYTLDPTSTNKPSPS